VCNDTQICKAVAEDELISAERVSNEEADHEEEAGYAVAGPCRSLAMLLEVEQLARQRKQVMMHDVPRLAQHSPPLAKAA
jgi:hypothetical protein